MAKRELFCANCGESIGVWNYCPGDGPESCGQLECNRACRDMEREAHAEREERARTDNYERY